MQIMQAYKNSSPKASKTQHISVIKTNRWKLHAVIIAIYCKNYTLLISTRTLNGPYAEILVLGPVIYVLTSSLEKANIPYNRIQLRQLCHVFLHSSSPFIESLQ